MSTIHLIYLAAGNSERFDANKLIYKIDGKPLFEYGLDLMIDLMKERLNLTLTVVSQYAEIISKAHSYTTGTGSSFEVDLTTNKRINVEFCISGRRGMSFSINKGLEAIKNDVRPGDYICFVMADQPYLKKETMLNLLDSISNFTEEAPAAVLACGERIGTPMMFSAKLIPEFEALKDDEGIEAVLEKHGYVRVLVHSAKELKDIDTKEDL